MDYVFTTLMGSPSVEEWSELGVIAQIMRLLSIPAGSHGQVKKIHQQIYKKNHAGEAYDPLERLSGEKKSRRLIQEGSDDANMVYRSLQAGLSVTMTTMLLNQMRQSRKEEPICRSTLHNFVCRSDMIIRAYRQTKKSGNNDPDSTWAICHLAQCLQWQEGIRLGKLPRNHPDRLAAVEEGKLIIELHAILWWDEHHRKVIALILRRLSVFLRKLLLLEVPWYPTSASAVGVALNGLIKRACVNQERSEKQIYPPSIGQSTPIAIEQYK
jgi:hypothetical protein